MCLYDKCNDTDGGGGRTEEGRGGRKKEVRGREEEEEIKCNFNKIL